MGEHVKDVEKHKPDPRQVNGGLRCAVCHGAVIDNPKARGPVLVHAERRAKGERDGRWARTASPGFMRRRMRDFEHDMLMGQAKMQERLKALQEAEGDEAGL